MGERLNPEHEGVSLRAASCGTSPGWAQRDATHTGGVFKHDRNGLGHQTRGGRSSLREHPDERELRTQQRPQLAVPIQGWIWLCRRELVQWVTKRCCPEVDRI